MLSRLAAARLLADASDRRALATLATTLGFSPPDPLDPAARATLGLPRELRRPAVARGRGTLRIMLAERGDTTTMPTRALLQRTAARLAARTPQLLWLLVVTTRDGHEVGVAAWTPHEAGPHVHALVVDRRRVVESDADTLAALAAARHDDAGADLLVHQRWNEILGRDALSRRFYRELERCVTRLATDLAPAPPPGDARALALLCTSRLLFLAFLQSRGWLDGDGDFLVIRFAACMARGGGFHRRVLLPLWFGTLNTPRTRRAPAARALGAIPFLNGGLFARTPLERRHRHARFSDAALGALFDDLLVRYRFTAREDESAFSDAAVDPEMLGRAFESLMHAGDRRATGAFYTPQPLVEAVTTQALAHALAEAGGAGGGDDDTAAHRLDEAAVRAALAGRAPPPAVAAILRTRAAELRLLDPACGSGAFLVHALERLAALHATLGDTRPVHQVRREVLARSIFGVDVNPVAAWLCELRLWLSVVIDDPAADARDVAPLPNLDHHIRVGDALDGDAFHDAVASAPPDARAAPRRAAGRALARLRDRYVRAVGRRKRTLATALERAERQVALTFVDARLATIDAQRRELLAAARTPDLFGERHPPGITARDRLRTLREGRREATARRQRLAGGALPFAFPTHFADVDARDGFDVLLGNPPWVRLHHVPPEMRRTLRARFRALHDATWAAGARAGGASAGFAGQADIAALFTERALQLLAPGGTLAFLLPAKLWCTLAGGGIRAVLGEAADILALEDWSEAPATFDAAVYPSLLVARRRPPRAARDDARHDAREDAAPAIRATRHRRAGALHWHVAPAHLGLDDDPASPWLPLPPEVRTAFRRVTDAGTAFADRAAGRPILGVKCGCNEAFVVQAIEDARADGLSLVHGADGEAALLEASLLRPVLRGQQLAAWTASTGAGRILWPLDDADRALAALPPHALAWLTRYRARLARRSDARAQAHGPWWTLFRTEGARADTPRVVWADVGRTPRAAVLQAGDATVPLNSCYVARCVDLTDAYALAALLNSPLAAAWLGVLAEPARGGYRRFLAWTVARLPLPRDWPRARALLAPLGARATAGETLGTHALLDAALEAYGVRRSAVGPLLLWAGG